MYGEISFLAHLNDQLEEETELPQPAADGKACLAQLEVIIPQI